MAKSTHILHNTMKPSTRKAVEHEAWARGTRGPELKDQDQGTRTRTRTREPEPGGSRSRRQDRDPGKNRQSSKTREQPGPERQRPWDDHRPEKRTEAGEEKEEVRTSKRKN